MTPDQQSGPPKYVGGALSYDRKVFTPEDLELKLVPGRSAFLGSNCDLADHRFHAPWFRRPFRRVANGGGGVSARADAPSDHVPDEPRARALAM